MKYKKNFLKKTPKNHNIVKTVLNNNKGITLVVLVITIIVMLILASVTLNVTLDGGIFSYAKRAKLETELDELQEKLKTKKINSGNSAIDGKINTLLKIESEYNNALEIENGKLVYIKDKWSSKDIQILEEFGIEKCSFDEYKENEETIYYIANENTLEKYEELTNVGTLEDFRDLVNTGTFTYDKALLIEDIQLNVGKYSRNSSGNLVFASDATQWIPIGTNTNKFTKIFDGQGYTISGLYINNTNNEQALFYVNNGTIKNVRIKQGYIKANEYVSAIVAKNIGIIENCYSNVKMEGVKNVSGIASYNQGTIKNCCNNGMINGNEYVGGIVGSVHSGTVEACLNEGDVTGSGVFTGGIVGYLSEEIKNCYNLGVITSEKAHTGGIVGIVSSKDAIVYNCYNLGNIDGIGSSGAIAGRNDGTVKNCYYLETSSDCLVGIAYTGILNDGSSKTATEMKTPAFLTLLNTITTTTTTINPDTQEEVTTTTTTTQNVWVPDTKGINKGYPILSWQD